LVENKQDLDNNKKTNSLILYHLFQKFW
jgi:hypothetical protein